MKMGGRLIHVNDLYTERYLLRDICRFRIVNFKSQINVGDQHLMETKLFHEWQVV